MYGKWMWCCVAMISLVFGLSPARAESRGEAFHKVVVVVGDPAPGAAGPVISGESRLVVDASSHEPWAKMLVRTGASAPFDEPALLQRVETDTTKTELYGAITEERGKSRVRFVSVSWPGPSLE